MQHCIDLPFQNLTPKPVIADKKKPTPKSNSAATRSAPKPKPKTPASSRTVVVKSPPKTPEAAPKRSPLPKPDIEPEAPVQLSPEMKPTVETPKMKTAHKTPVLRIAKIDTPLMDSSSPIASRVMKSARRRTPARTVTLKTPMPLRLTALKEKKPTVVPFEADENAVTIAPAPKSGRKSTSSLLKGAASLLILI